MSKVPMATLIEELNVPPRMKDWIEWNFQFADDNMEDIREWFEKLLNRSAEVKRLSKDRDLLWDAIRLSGTGGHQEEEIAFWHEKLLNMNEAELKEAFKEHYEDEVDA